MYAPHLLRDKLCSSRIILPFPQEYLSQERIQGFLFRSMRIASAAVLLMESAEEPFEDQ